MLEIGDGKTLGGGQYRTCRLNEFVTDGRFNRPISRAHVNAIVSDFDPRAFMVIVAWEREDGRLVILDGQHRRLAAEEAGVEVAAKCIPAIVHRGLTLSKAAELFVRLNASKLVSAYDKYNALRTAGHLDTIAIEQIVRAHEVKVTPAPGDGCISCVVAVQAVFHLGEPKGVVLGHALRTLSEAWGGLKESLTAPILRGIGIYFHENRDADPTLIADCIVRGPQQPMNLIAWAKTIAGTQRVPLDRAIADVIETRVLKRRRRPRSA